ncbi:hypothetical protein F4808DRAFT_441454 [Astrocystis sublimbata]|nr:hypothetical protein F4808DRAFT_441454 [Astrocystis sublimbata]
MYRHRLSDERVVRALEAIENTELPYPSTWLLTSFIHAAMDPVLAAIYVNDRMANGDARSLVSDWVYIIESITRKGSLPNLPDANAQRAITRRDGNRCCITGKKGSIFDPLCVVPVIAIPTGWITEEGRVFDMMGAFLGPPYRDWWFDFLKDPDYMTPYANHWLVRRSASVAYANGFVKLQRLDSMIEFQVQYAHVGPVVELDVEGNRPLLGDHSRSGMVKVDARFIGTHARLCTSIRLLDLARCIAAQILDGPRLSPSTYRPQSYPRESPIKRAMSRTLSSMLPLGTLGRVALSLWLMTPRRVRITAYGLLRKIGEALYGKSTFFVQRLPFGLYLKHHLGEGTYRNEHNAMRLVQQYTTVPLPKPLDLILARDSTPESDEEYLLMTRLPGLPLSQCNEILSESDCERITMQMQDYLTQIRCIPNMVNDENPICNTLGIEIRDSRIRSGRPMGPFPDEAAFSNILRLSDDPGRRGHSIVFTHGDLNPRNILIDLVTQPDGSEGWSVSGIVDWEFAGYYPEYWDFTKSLFEGFRWKKRYNDMVKNIFKAFGDYSQELDVETRAWGMGDGI